ncbi:perlwapin [Haliotis rubra]|uniref:perlwapin n=1 Tax=Haliotis rubra TaxID=36100 RepID=UPI001EE5ECAF|nr:perlwapin [Haliotis rubra]
MHLLLCLVVCTAAVLGTASGYGPNLPGCPPGGYPRICARYCYSDRDCKAGYYCCNTGCLNICVPKPKPGLCPAIPPGPCKGNVCSNDQDCPGNQKCCGKPRCRRCYRPEKPGSCPPRKYDAGVCVAYCVGDFDCPGNEKCCGSCPRLCEKPCFD